MNKDIVSAVRALGAETIEVEPYCGLSSNAEASHADMQLLALPEGDIFLLRGCGELENAVRSAAGSGRVRLTEQSAADFAYPECVKLNIAVFGRRAVGNFRYCDKKMTERLKALGYRLINVKQGYSKCSVSIVSDDAIITADKGIAEAAAADGADVLLISRGGIALCERYGGFIGGASFLLDGTLHFLGDVTAHPDCERIHSFCSSHGVRVSSLTAAPLLDIGGVVFFETENGSN